MTVTKKDTSAEPSLKDLFDLFKKDVMLSLNCHTLGTIQGFDSVKQTVKVTINYKKSFFKYNTETQQYDVELLDYPPLADVPVIIMGGGTSHLTFPISVGDECLLLFNDRDLDNWFAGNKNGVIATGRLHSFTDAIALIGVRSQANKLSAYDTDRARLYNGDTSVGVSADKVQIKNADKNLGAILDSLTDALSSLTVNTSTGVPNPPWSSNIASIKADLLALLE